jgi:hypothetical protein
MPSSLKRWRVVFVWLLRAWAFRRWWYVIFRAAVSNNLAAAVRPKLNDWIRAATAVCNWHTVRSGFFPPPLLSQLRQKQVTHGGDDQVAFEPQIAPPFLLIQADFPFVVFEAPLHPPAREGHL